MGSVMRHLLKTLGTLTIILLLVIALPIATVELTCRGEPLPQSEARYITAPNDQRPEARTYLTYPEWHIVYAYEGYAETLKTGKPHDFPYAKAVFGFWKSLCALTKKSDTLGQAGFDAKSTIYTIGASFTLEMVAKAIYEETIGRIVALTGTSPQDTIEAEMAKDYANFLQQIPWYKYDFDAQTTLLWDAPTANFRAYERRIALGLEWKAKAAYARLIARAVAGMTPDALTMKIAISNVDPITLQDVKLIETQNQVAILDVPRYRIFTRLVEQIASKGGTIQEIAGNDDILVSMIIEQGDFYPAKDHTLLSRTARVGFTSDRVLLAVPVKQLHTIFAIYPNTPIRVEHIYDY
jgi:hypothetical protein